MDHNLHTATWRSPSCRTHGKPKTHHPETPRTRTCTRTNKLQDLVVRHGPVCTDKPGMEGATNDLIIRIRENKEVKVVRMTQPTQAECVKSKGTGQQKLEDEKDKHETKLNEKEDWENSKKDKEHSMCKMNSTSNAEERRWKLENDQDNWSGNRRCTPDWRKLQRGQTHTPPQTPTREQDIQQDERPDENQSGQTGICMQPTKHPQGCTDWHWHQEVRNPPANFTSGNTLNRGEELQGQHSQHRRDLQSAGTDSDPDGNQEIHQVCWKEETPEQVQLTGGEDNEHIILDTNSKYNIMGLNARRKLCNMIKLARCHPLEMEETSSLFSSSKGKTLRSKELLKFAINLTCNLLQPLTPIEVYCVPVKTPFIIGGDWIKNNRVILDRTRELVKMNRGVTDTETWG